jgi:hypothetical protein
MIVEGTSGYAKFIDYAAASSAQVPSDSPPGVVAVTVSDLGAIPSVAEGQPLLLESLSAAFRQVSEILLHGTKMTNAFIAGSIFHVPEGSYWALTTSAEAAEFLLSEGEKPFGVQDATTNRYYDAIKKDGNLIDADLSFYDNGAASLDQGMTAIINKKGGFLYRGDISVIENIPPDLQFLTSSTRNLAPVIQPSPTHLKAEAPEGLRIIIKDMGNPVPSCPPVDNEWKGLRVIIRDLGNPISRPDANTPPNNDSHTGDVGDRQQRPKTGTSLLQSGDYPAPDCVPANHQTRPPALPAIASLSQDSDGTVFTSTPAITASWLTDSEAWLTEHGVQAGMVLLQHQQREAKEIAYDRAVSQLMQGPPSTTLLDLPADVLIQLSSAQMNVLHRITLARANGTIVGPTQDNQRLYSGLLGEASASPQAFVTRDLYTTFDQLPPVQYQRLLTLKAAIKAGDPVEQCRQIALANGLTLAAGDLAAAKLSDQPGPDRTPSDRQVFIGQVVRLFDAWQANNPGRTAHDGDLLTLIRQALDWRTPAATADEPARPGRGHRNAKPIAPIGSLASALVSVSADGRRPR